MVENSSSFGGWIPRKRETRATRPDFAGPLRIGESLLHCSVWLNHCKDARPYLAVRLKRHGSNGAPIKVALWQKEPSEHFEAVGEVEGTRLLLSARIDHQGLQLGAEPAWCWDAEALGRAKLRLSIPVLWQILGLSGTVRPHCCVKSPLRSDDHHPSFSIYEEGRRFKDHGTGTGGDALDFFRSITKLDSKTAYKRFLELAGIPL